MINSLQIGAKCRVTRSRNGFVNGYYYATIIGFTDTGKVKVLDNQTKQVKCVSPDNVRV